MTEIRLIWSFIWYFQLKDFCNILFKHSVALMYLLYTYISAINATYYLVTFQEGDWLDTAFHLRRKYEYVCVCVCVQKIPWSSFMLIT
jgi:hypothetical protein